MRIENEVIVDDWEAVPFEGNVEILSGFPFDSSKFNDSVGMPLIRIRNILTSTTETYFNGEFQDDFIINSGDILVGMDGDFHIKKWTGEKALLNQRNLKLFNDGNTKIDLDFFFYLAQPFLMMVHNRTSGTTVKHLSTKDFRNAHFKVPPLPEQQKIAEILSTVDKKIDAIDQRIAQTQDLKKGLMQNLLTGKLSVVKNRLLSEAEMKDSPLGEIPESWELVPIYELRDKTDRYGFTGGPFGSDLKSEHYTESGVKILQLQNIGEGKFIDKGITFTSEEKADELFSCNIFPGDIILAKMAPVARSCKVPSTDDRYVMCSDGIRLSVDKDKFSTEFVFQAINSKYFLNNAEAKSTGTTRARIGLKDLKLIPIAVPKNIAEQKQIAEILSTVDKKLQIQEDKKTEYQTLKKGLMQQLLTGRVRVNTNVTANSI